jgi:hypothetical protein
MPTPWVPGQLRPTRCQVWLPGAIPGYRSPPLIGQQQRLQLLRDVLVNDSVALPYRVAAGLVLLFGQAASRIVALRVQDLRAGDDDVQIKLGTDWLPVPSPFAELLTAHLQHRPTCRPRPTPTPTGCSPAGT